MDESIESKIQAVGLIRRSRSYYRANNSTPVNGATKDTIRALIATSGSCITTKTTTFRRNPQIPDQFEMAATHILHIPIIHQHNIPPHTNIHHPKHKPFNGNMQLRTKYYFYSILFYNQSNWKTTAWTDVIHSRTVLSRHISFYRGELDLSLSSSPAIMPLAALYFGLYYLEGHTIFPYFPRSTWTSNPFLFPVLKLRRILRKNYPQNSIFTQKPSRPTTTNLDGQQYTYYYKQARHNRITRFDFLFISLLPQIQPKQHIWQHFRKNSGVALETSFEDPQQKSSQAGSRALQLTQHPSP
jgi:hypothetical protein